jgi:UDP-2-acetamido-3-amino-2,3-dideoxy-glucuronate N-acetyltransferase
MVAAGELGRLQHVYSHRLNFGKIRREEDILWSFAPHDISMILSLFGEEPERVSAIGSCFLHASIADMTTTHLEFPGGGRAHVFVSWLHPHKVQQLVVVGDESMAVFDDTQPWESKLAVYPHRIEWRNGSPITHKADVKWVKLDETEPLKEEARHFLACIAGETNCITDGDEATRVLKVLRASQESISAGGPVYLSDLSSQRPEQSYYIHPSSYVDEGGKIGNGTKIWHFSHVLSGSQVGNDCVIGQNVVIGPDVTIGNNCKIQNNVSVYNGVTLEDGVFCGPSCVFTNVINPRSEIERKDEFRPTLVRQGATIGANATIVCGVELGEYCFIGAGAVVTRDVPAFALITGVPAKQKGWVSHSGEVLEDDLVCPGSGRRYKLNESGNILLEDTDTTKFVKP